MTQPSQSGAAALPNPQLRTVLSLLLFMHLFAVMIGVLSYNGPAQSSGLLDELRRVFSPYLTALNFDLTHDRYPLARLYLTQATPADVDFTIHINTNLPDGSTKTVTIPPDRAWPGARRQRYQALANAVGTMAATEDAPDDTANLLPRTLAAGVLDELDATEATVVCRGHYLVAIADLADSASPAARNPMSAQYFRDVYSAKVWYTGGQINLMKLSAAGEMAPVDRKQ